MVDQQHGNTVHHIQVLCRYILLQFFNNIMLPIISSHNQVGYLLEDACIPGTELTSNLPNQIFIWPDGEYYFEVDNDQLRKGCLLNTLYNTGLTLEKVDIISKFEKERSKRYLCLDSAATRVPDAVPMYPDGRYWKEEEEAVVVWE